MKESFEHEPIKLKTALGETWFFRSPFDHETHNHYLRFHRYAQFQSRQFTVSCKTCPFFVRREDLPLEILRRYYINDQKRLYLEDEALGLCLAYLTLPVNEAPIRRPAFTVPKFLVKPHNPNLVCRKPSMKARMERAERMRYSGVLQKSESEHK